MSKFSLEEKVGVVIALAVAGLFVLLLGMFRPQGNPLAEDVEQNIISDLGNAESDQGLDSNINNNDTDTMEENAATEFDLDSEGDVLINTDGLSVQQLQAGQGEAVESGDTVSVQYTGYLEDGNVFDSSRGRGAFTYTFGTGQVIIGWEEGLAGMQEGEVRKLLISPEKAYGAVQGHPLQEETLIFVVELESIGSSE